MAVLMPMASKTMSTPPVNPPVPRPVGPEVLDHAENREESRREDSGRGAHELQVFPERGPLARDGDPGCPGPEEPFGDGLVDCLRRTAVHGFPQRRCPGADAGRRGPRGGGSICLPGSFRSKDTRGPQVRLTRRTPVSDPGSPGGGGTPGKGIGSSLKPGSLVGQCQPTFFPVRSLRGSPGVNSAAVYTGPSTQVRSPEQMEHFPQMPIPQLVYRSTTW